MTYKIEIASSSDNRLLANLEKNFGWIKERGYNLNISNEDNLDFNFIELILEGNNSDRYFDEQDILYIFRHQLSEILAEHIIKDWEKKLLWKEISKNYRVIPLEDKQIIYKKSNEFLKLYNHSETINMLINFSRKNKIANKILDHLEKNSLFVIEGFINFCMQDYLTEIKFAVDLAYEELKNEKEYNEFVKLLRYFVETQPSRVYEVNLKMQEDGVFFLWDGNGVKIEENYMNYYLDDIMLNDISLDDVLISILITISPKRIVLHYNEDLEDNDPVQIIKRVFKERIITCSGCERCNTESQLKNKH